MKLDEIDAIVPPETSRSRREPRSGGGLKLWSACELEMEAVSSP
jgi:hypothetical protein